ncbi:MAG: hypothetical protein ACTHKC_06905 [Candidatus Nitrosocosmicus sp.]
MVNYQLNVLLHYLVSAIWEQNDKRDVKPMGFGFGSMYNYFKSLYPGLNPLYS